MSSPRSVVVLGAVIVIASILAGVGGATVPTLLTGGVSPGVVPQSMPFNVGSTWDDSPDAPQCMVDYSEWYPENTTDVHVMGQAADALPCGFSFAWSGTPLSVGLGPGSYIICVRAKGPPPSGGPDEWSAPVCAWDLTVTSGGSGDNLPPVCNYMALDPNPANSMNGYNVTVTFNFDDSMRGDSAIAAAEYFVTPPYTLPINNGTGDANWTIVSPPFGTAPSVLVQRLDLDVSSWTPGIYGFRGHGLDVAGNWGWGPEGLPPPPVGVCSSALMVEAPSTSGGPTITNLQLLPNPAVRGTDTSSHLSGLATETLMVSVITAAEYFVGPLGPAGTGSPMNATDGAFDSAVEDIESDIQIQGWLQGNYPISVHAMSDSWGPFSQIILTIVTGGPGNEPPTITVNWPNGGERLSGGAPQNIGFSASDPDNLPATVNVTFELSRDNGLNWGSIPGSRTALASSFPWNVTCPSTTTALVRGTAADPFGLSGTDTSNLVFTIDCDPPTVSAVNPVPSSTNVPQSANIRLTFSEAMNPPATQGAFTLVNVDTGSSVPGASSWSGGNSVLDFNPTVDLPSCTNYTANVVTTARDASNPGLTMVNPWTSGFRTGGPGWCAPKVLTRIEIIPWPGPIVVGPFGTLPFTAKGVNDDSSVNTSWTSSWSLQNSRGSISIPVWDGVGKVWQLTYTAPGTNPGWQNLMVNGGGKSNKTTIQVVPGPPTGVTLLPSSVPLLAPGSGVSFTARAYDAQGVQVLQWTPIWSDDGPGTIVPTGGSGASGFTAAYTARSTPGQENVTVTISSTTISDSTPITVVDVPPPDPLVRIELLPTTPFSMEVGTSAAFTALGFSQSGGQNLTWSPSWSVSGGTLIGNGGNAAAGFTATFQAGTVAGLGQVRVLTGTVENTTSITLRPGPIVSISVSPPSAVLQPLQTAEFGAQAHDVHNNVNKSWVADKSLSSALGTLGAFTWDVSNLWRVTFTAGTVLGSATLTITAAGVAGVAGTADLTVEPGPLDHLVVTPASVTLNVGSGQTFSAQGFDVWDHLNLTWSPSGWNSGSALGTVGNFGGGAASGFTAVYTATLPGDDTILVTRSSITGQASVHNTARAGPLASVEIVPWPGPTIVNPADAVGLTAFGFDSLHNLNTSWLPVWGTSNAAGILGNLGGSGATGFTATYVAGPTEGTDNVTVSPVGLPSVSNRTAIRIAVSGPLARVEITPGTVTFLEILGSLEYTARGFDASDVMNTTWTPEWSLTAGIGILSSIREVSPGEHHALFTRTAVGSGVLTVREVATTAEDSASVDHLDVPPTSSAGPIPPFLTTLTFSIPWEATDDGGSGLASVEMWWRFNANGWVYYTASSPTPGDPVSFTAGQDGTYDFYTRARDNAGNYEAAPAVPDASVTIDATAPRFLSSAPTAGATEVPLVQPIRLVFSETVDLASLQSAALVVADGARVQGVWGVSGSTATFTPGSPLPAGAAITVSLSPGQTHDPAGNPMPDAVVVTFRTAGSTEGTGIVSGSPFLGPLMAAFALFLILIPLLLILWTRRHREQSDDPATRRRSRFTFGRSEAGSVQPDPEAAEATGDEPEAKDDSQAAESGNGNGGASFRRLLRPVPKKK